MSFDRGLDAYGATLESETNQQTGSEYDRQNCQRREL